MCRSAKRLEIIKGVKKSHNYLYDWPFMIIMEHKYLLGLLAEDHQTPSKCFLPRSSFLAAYQYTLQYRRGNSDAGTISHLLLP